MQTSERISDDSKASVLQSPNLVGSEWNFSDSRSNVGGAGSGFHWNTTHFLKLHDNGHVVLHDIEGKESEGTWELHESTGTTGQPWTCELTFGSDTFQMALSSDQLRMQQDDTAICFLMKGAEGQTGTTPATYLTLPSGPNFSTITAGGTVHGNTGMCAFYKLARVCHVACVFVCF